jgi:hypothetical protein
VKPLADAAFKGIVKAVPELARAMRKVDDAIKQGTDGDTIETYRRDLVIKTRAVSHAREQAVAALRALSEVTQDDDDFEADLDEVEALQEKLAKARDLLGAQIVKAKGCEDRARAAAEKSDRSEKVAHQQWDALIARYERATADMERWVKEMRAWKRDAEAAVAARDAAALKKAKEGFRGMVLDDDVLEGKKLLKWTNELLSGFDLDSFSKAFVEEIARDRATTVGEFDKRSQAGEQEAKKIEEAFAKLEIKPPDAVKATAELGFKANFNTRVEAALKLDESKMAQELEKIWKDASKLQPDLKKRTGKEMIELLKAKKIL